jgi:hypothetical protein
MKRLIYRLLIAFFFSCQCLFAAAADNVFDNLEGRVIKQAESQFEGLIRQNTLNDLSGMSSQNRYVIYIDVNELTADKPLLYQRKGWGKENYVTGNEQVLLDSRLAAIHTATGISPFMLIIHNMPLVLNRQLATGKTLKSVFEGEGVSAADAAATKLVQENSDKISNTIQASVKGSLKKAVFICWTRYVAIWNNTLRSGFYEVYSRQAYDLDETVCSLISDEVKGVGNKDRYVRATQFVGAVEKAVNQYALLKPPTDGPGKEFYDTYKGRCEDQSLLILICNTINSMGTNIYGQYLDDIGHETGNSTDRESFLRFYQSLQQYQNVYTQWAASIGNITDPNRILLRYVTTPKRDGWFANLWAKDRLAALKVLNNGNLSGTSNFVAAIVGQGHGGEEFALSLIGNTPKEQQDSLLTGLGQQGLLEGFVSKIDGANFATFINYITQFIQNVYPPSNVSIESLILQKRYIGFDGTFFGPATSQDFESNGEITLTVRKNFHFRFDADIKVSPYSYVLVDFKADFDLGAAGKFLKGQRVKLPAIYCYYLFNEMHSKQLVLGAKIALNVAMFAIGVGELNAALQAANGVRVALAAVDLGLFAIDLAVQGCEEYLEKHSPGFLKVWTAINLVYAGARITYEFVQLASSAEKSLIQMQKEADFTALPMPKQAMIADLEKKAAEMVRKGEAVEEVVAATSMLSKLLARTKELPELTTWLNKAIPDEILTSLNGWSDVNLGELNKALSRYKGLGDDILDPKLFRATEKAIENPLDAWKAIKEAGDDITEAVQRNAQKQFFKEITEVGKKFEGKVLDELLGKAQGVLQAKLAGIGIDLKKFEIFGQVQIKTGKMVKVLDEATGELVERAEFFIGDFVLVPKVADGFGGFTLDVEKAIVLESKLSQGTALTANQASALEVARAGTAMTVRSTKAVSAIEKSTQILKQGKELKVTSFIKVFSGGTGDAVSDILKIF